MGTLDIFLPEVTVLFGAIAAFVLSVFGAKQRLTWGVSIVLCVLSLITTVWYLDARGDRQAAGDDLPSSPRNPEDSTSGAELTGHVREALDQLSPSLRMPVILYDIEGLAYGEIAKVLGIAEGTVKSRIHRARRALRDQLKDLLVVPAAEGT